MATSTLVNIFQESGPRSSTASAIKGLRQWKFNAPLWTIGGEPHIGAGKVNHTVKNRLWRLEAMPYSDGNSQKAEL